VTVAGGSLSLAAAARTSFCGAMAPELELAALTAWTGSP
jgi:hypothetical protein